MAHPGVPKRIKIFSSADSGTRTALQLALHVLGFVRSLREVKLPLCIDCLPELAPWFFSLDHTSYASWVPVHIRDMSSLRKMHPKVPAEFQNGNFIVRKTSRVFSSMEIDQVHEQKNAAGKSDGGAVELTQSPDALRRWMVSGAELARMTTEFEASLETKR